MYVFSSLIFAYVDCLILWLIQDGKEAKFETQKLGKLLWEIREEMDNYLETTKKDPKEELLEKCRIAGLGKRDTALATMYYYEQQTPKEIWLWLCQQKEFEQIEWDSIRKVLWRIGKKIKNTTK
jgi:hypothetical protein